MTDQTPSLQPRQSWFTTPLRVILATTAALWIGGASGQTAAPALQRSSAMELRFRDFFSSPIGPKGLELSDALHRADGKQVRITGYMVQNERPPLGRFLLTPRPVQMSEHADGDADDLPATAVTVYLDPTQQGFTVPHVRGLVEVSGILSVGRYEESDGRVSWVRLQLAPEATRGMNGFEVANYLHQLQHTH
jgi:hypothetical protein